LKLKQIFSKFTKNLGLTRETCLLRKTFVRSYLFWIHLHILMILLQNLFTSIILIWKRLTTR